MPTSGRTAPRPDPSRAVKDSFLRIVYGGFAAIFAVVLLVAYFAVRHINRSVAASDWVNHTHATIYEIENAGTTLLAGDALVRTYVLTGEARDLAAAREALAAHTEHFETAKALTRDEPALLQTLQRLEPQAQARAAFARQLGAARAANQTEEVRRLLAADAGTPGVGEVRRGLGKLRDELFEKLSARDRAAFLQAENIRWLVGSGVALNLLLFAAVAWLIRDDLAARRRLTASLRDANADLEVRVRERTRELTEANDRLTTENMERKWALQSQEHQLRYNQLIVNSVNDLVFVLTKALNVTRINAAVRQATGAEDQAILTQPLAQVVRFRPREGEPTVEPFRQALADGRELRDQPALLTTRHGAVLPARASLVPLRDRDKVVGGVLIVQLHPTAANAHA